MCAQASRQARGPRMRLHLGQVEIATHSRAHTHRKAFVTEVSNRNRTLPARWLGNASPPAGRQMQPEIGGGRAFLVAVYAAIFPGHSLLQCAQIVSQSWKMSSNETDFWRGLAGTTIWKLKKYGEEKGVKISFRFGLVFEYFTRPSAYLGAHGVRIFSIFC